MRNQEFAALCTANTNKTERIRTYSGKWYAGPSQVPDNLFNKIGKIVALIHAQLDKGLLCKPNECLLIYNFQPNYAFEHRLNCSVQMLIKPLSDLHDTENDSGRPLQLIVNGITHKVSNVTQGLLEVGLITEEEIQEEELEPPITYGDYLDYKAPCCFAAIASYRPINDMNLFFDGTLDQSACIKESRVFDSSIEARDYLRERSEQGRYVAEIIGCKEDYEYYKHRGLSTNILKIINFFDQTITVNPNQAIQKREDKIEDELKRVEQIL